MITHIIQRPKPIFVLIHIQCQKTGFYIPKIRVPAQRSCLAGPENLPGEPGEPAWRAQRTCLAGPENLPGGPGQPAWRAQIRCLSLRAQRTCLAGPENLPGGPGQPAWRARRTCLTGWPTRQVVRAHQAGSLGPPGRFSGPARQLVRARQAGSLGPHSYFSGAKRVRKRR